MPEASHPHGHSGPPAPTVAPSQQVTTTRPRRPSQRLVLSPAVKARRNGLWLPAQLTIEDWSEIGMQIATIGDSSAWWLGDWLVYGKKKYPDRYKQAISATALDYQTLRNYAWVCRQFPIPRRHPTLSFQHHAELASLTPDQQDEWLDKAEALGWSLHALRRQLKAGAVGRRKRKDGHLTLKLPATHIQQERWRLAATATGADIEKWIVMTLDDAAETQEPKNAENLEERTTS
jgi:hypothetical protein